MIIFLVVSIFLSLGGLAMMYVGATYRFRHDDLTFWAGHGVHVAGMMLLAVWINIVLTEMQKCPT